MVTTNRGNKGKNAEKTPASSIRDPSKSKMPNDVRVMASSNGAPTSLEAELHALRLRNKVLTEALQAIKETADIEAKKNFELVWIARNRSRHPNHKERKRIESQHSKELEKLETSDADYYHGVHSGCLATARMFQKQADILHINDPSQVSDEMVSVAAQHKKKVEESRKVFPQLSVDGMM